MRIRVTDNDLGQQKADVAVCFAHENDKSPLGVRDTGLRRELAAQMKAQDFKGLSSESLSWNSDGRYGARRFMVVGLGPKNSTPGEAIRRGCVRASREAARFHAKKLALCIPRPRQGVEPEEARAAIEGAILGAYQFDRYLTDPARRNARLESVELAVNGGSRAVTRAVKIGEIVAQATCLARDLVNEAPSRMSPAAMTRVAAKQAKQHGLRCKVLGPAELRRIGMRSVLAVARGSDEAARVVHLTYTPARRAKAAQRIVLVGKGVTFDSGGLNLKPGNSMLTMKSDMAGAAAVLAAMTALKAVGCRAEVHGLLGLVENMTGPDAYKPGDILETYSGKTVEIGNTDAEGRLVLCDLLAYAAKKLKPTRVVDVATLTGACVVALGTMASGVFTRHEDLQNELLAAGRAAGEKMWPMPMYEEYLQLLQKGPADLRNVAGRWGGAITAALFLGEFLPRDLSWAHLDIAGPAFSENDVPDAPLGATGAGAPTLVRWLETV